MISFVWAEDKNHTIGVDGHLPWTLPADMRRFKETTMNHPIVMGRKTFESFPNGPLPKRLNIVISRNKDYQVPESVVLITDKADLKKYVQEDAEVMVIGGSGIFNLFKNDVDRLYLTRINHEFKGDTKMIDLDYKKFKLVEKKEGHTDKDNLYPYTFETWDKL